MELPPRLLSVRELADFFSVSDAAIRTWANEGRLVPIRIGVRTIRFAPASVARFIASGGGPVNRDDPADTGSPQEVDASAGARPSG
jgi:predicted DNA-binding transcriptional regulator AlpA